MIAYLIFYWYIFNLWINNIIIMKKYLTWLKFFVELLFLI